MPNWCHNTLTISGEAEYVQEFVNQMSAHKNPNHKFLQFNDFVPIPADIPEGFDSNSWHVANWGTKWDLDPDDQDTEVHSTQIDCTFDTAWQPPENWLHLVSDMYPTLKFELFYMCEAGDYEGQITIYGDNMEETPRRRAECNVEEQEQQQ
jgi:hypothetical protein